MVGSGWFPYDSHPQKSIGVFRYDGFVHEVVQTFSDLAL